MSVSMIFDFFHRKPKVKSTSGSHYEPLPKYYVFNETGNIMLCTTQADVSNLSDDFRTICAEISVFFAAMTKAIHSVTNPLTDKPYSIYNYQAVKNVMLNSGMFIEVNQQNVMFSSKQVGEGLNKDLMQTILGREFGESKLNFTQGMFQAMDAQALSDKSIVDKVKQHAKGDESESVLLKQQQKAKQDNRAGSIFFVCESLLGMPQISTILVNITPASVHSSQSEMQKVKKEDDFADFFKLSFKDEQKHTNQGRPRQWMFKKRTYIFVPPKFLKRYINDIDEVDDPDFDAFIEKMRTGLKQMSD